MAPVPPLALHIRPPDWNDPATPNLANGERSGRVIGAAQEIATQPPETISTLLMSRAGVCPKEDSEV
jgi:hypothetical protein